MLPTLPRLVLALAALISTVTYAQMNPGRLRAGASAAADLQFPETPSGTVF